MKIFLIIIGVIVGIFVLLLVLTGIIGYFEEKDKKNNPKKYRTEYGRIYIHFPYQLDSKLILIEASDGERMWRGRGTLSADFVVYDEYTDLRFYILEGDEKQFIVEETLQANYNDSYQLVYENDEYYVKKYYIHI